MWPLPAHIDSVAAYSTVPAALDVDGAHFVGHSQLSAGRRDARALDHYKDHWSSRAHEPLESTPLSERHGYPGPE